MDNDPFKEYIKQSEPTKREKGYAWHTAIGLQAVDGLKPSQYLIDTATTAVFFIKYLRTLGFDATNDIFAENAWYFRNALVRANYNDLKNGIHETTEYLELFLRNLLLNEKNELHNRAMHISGVFSQSAKDNVQSANSDDLKCKNCTLEEMAIIRELTNNPGITQKELAAKIGKSERTIKTRTVEMQKKGLICRENGKRNGKWNVLIKI